MSYVGPYYFNGDKKTDIRDICVAVDQKETIEA